MFERRPLHHECSLFAETVDKLCDGEARRVFSDMCRKLPEDECYRGEEKPRPKPEKCDWNEYDCGNGQCIAGLKVCDYRFDCANAADELQW